MERGDMSIKARRGEGRVNRFSKLTKWCKRVLTGQRGEAGEGKKSTRGKPPQGKIKTKASRTRAMTEKIAAKKAEILEDMPEIFGDSSLCPDCGHYRHGDRECGQPRRNQDPCRCPAQRLEDQHLEATEIMDSEEGMITSEASKIFLAYLEGDQEAAKIVEGWAQKERDRSASTSRRAVDDARHVDGRYASGE